MTSSSNNNNNDNTTIPPPPSNGRPLRIGVFGGSFNPIHLGHALLAITTQQTKPVDQVVLVPVFKHAVKRDLLPFDDRVAMCRLAVAPFASNNSIVVSTVEQRVGASNGAMLRALKEEYPPHTELLYICGDDFFQWMEKPKGLETLKEVDGLIVQRRLHKQLDSNDNNDRFFKEPLDEQNVRAVAARLGLTIDFIYGELPHFSSTLVRRAPGHWRSFLPQTVSAYLEERPPLLQQLIHNLEADSLREQQQQQPSKTTAAASSSSVTSTTNDNTNSAGKRKRSNDGTDNDTDNADNNNDASEWVMRGLTMVHFLQIERGRSGLRLSLGTPQAEQDLQQAQANTDAIIQQVQSQTVESSQSTSNNKLQEVLGLALDLQQVPVWLTRDRQVLQQQCQALVARKGVAGWLARAALVEKFNPRIDVLRLSLLRALTEIRTKSNSSMVVPAKSNNNNDEEEEEAPRDFMPDLLWKWSQAKEALGRLRAFVCAGGPHAPQLIAKSIEMRQRLNEYILEKDRSIDRVLSSSSSSSSSSSVEVPSTPDALHRLLENVTWWEWNLMRSFAPSTPTALVHKLLANKNTHQEEFDVEQFFSASTTAIDFLLTFTKALAAAACAS